ncbi:MAG: sugar transferase [Actinobacteria bacterium]|nr:sugar transferase [Actinomycetota bacterium]
MAQTIESTTRTTAQPVPSVAERPEPGRDHRGTIERLRLALGRASADRDARRRYRAIGAGILASDGLALLGALSLTHVLRFGLRPPGAGQALLAIVGLPIWIVIFRSVHLHAPHRLAPPEEFRRAIAASSMGMLIVLLTGSWSRLETPGRWIAVAWALALLFELVGRWGWRRFTGRLRADGRLAVRTLIVGTNDEAIRIARDLGRPGLGFSPIGHVAESLPAEVTGDLPVVGTVERLRAAIREQQAECVFVAATGLGLPSMRTVARDARYEGVELLVSSRLPEMIPTRLTVLPVGQDLALSLRMVELSRGQAILKRAFDLVVASVGLILVMPLWAVIAAAIRLDSPGPVLYRQERLGRAGEPFRMYKFRTMCVGAEELKEELGDSNRADGPLFKVPDDPRVTRAGRWLRRRSLDELPQLLNVVRGEMSLVGPRPPLREEVDQYEDWHLGRLDVAPGMTGLWQVSGRSDLTFDEYVRLDLFYIENWSLAYDLYVLAKTIPAVVSGRGSY